MQVRLRQQLIDMFRSEPLSCLFTESIPPELNYPGSQQELHCLGASITMTRSLDCFQTAHMYFLLRGFEKLKCSELRSCHEGSLTNTDLVRRLTSANFAAFCSFLLSFILRFLGVFRVLVCVEEPWKNMCSEPPYLAPHPKPRNRKKHRQSAVQVPVWERVHPTRAKLSVSWTIRLLERTRTTHHACAVDR